MKLLCGAAENIFKIFGICGCGDGAVYGGAGSWRLALIQDAEEVEKLLGRARLGADEGDIYINGYILKIRLRYTCDTSEGARVENKIHVGGTSSIITKTFKTFCCRYQNERRPTSYYYFCAKIWYFPQFSYDFPSHAFSFYFCKKVF